MISPSNENKERVGEVRRQPTRLAFGFVVLLSLSFTVREMKTFNAEYWNDNVRNNDLSETLPTSYTPWSAVLDAKTTAESNEIEAEKFATATETNSIATPQPEKTTIAKDPQTKEKEEVTVDQPESNNSNVTSSKESEPGKTAIADDNETKTTESASQSESNTSNATSPVPLEPVNTTIEENARNETKEPADQPESKKSNATSSVQVELAETKHNQTLTTTFQRYDKVAIVTKIHGPHQWLLLEQSICLLHFAYNHKVHYDIIVFSALEVPMEKIEELQKIVAPAKFEIVIDNMGLQEEIAALTPAKRELFLQRCNVSSPVNLTWWSECTDPGSDGKNRLAYNWQAEFRSVRVWEHPALEKYRYMFWLDSDGFPSRPFEKNPVEYFIKNEGVIMFENFPQGSDRGRHTKAILDSFNATVCGLRLGKNGHLERTLVTPEAYKMDQMGNKTIKCRKMDVPMIHGFGHITDLDFYRQPKVLNGLKGLLGNCFLCRSPDDQLAVTIPAAIYAPEKSFDMRSHGFNLGISHNYRFDGHKKEPVKPANFVKYWNKVGKDNFPEEAFKTCRVTAGSR